MYAFIWSRARRTLDVMEDDHDLPLLAADYTLPRPPDWESLLGDGVQPALVLGAERRWQGERQPGPP